MRTLYVCFKGKSNTSFQVVSALAGEHLFLTNSFAGLARDIEAIKADYDAVIMFGLDKALSGTVRLEKVAEIQGEILCTKCTVEHIAKVFRYNGIDCEISEVPTHYLCNEAYFRMLQKTKGKAIFIHIPSNRHMTTELMESIVRSLGGSPCPSFQNR